MPLHVRFTLTVGYVHRTVREHSAKISIDLSCKTEENVSSIEVMNFSVKASCQMLTQKSPYNCKVLQISTKDPIKYRNEMSKADLWLGKLLK